MPLEKNPHPQFSSSASILFRTKIESGGLSPIPPFPQVHLEALTIRNYDHYCKSYIILRVIFLYKISREHRGWQWCCNLKLNILKMMGAKGAVD